MRQLIHSLGLFIGGILRRAYYWGFALLLDPFDIYNRFIKPSLPEKWQADMNLPNEWGFGALIGLLIWSAVLTYHELRQENIQLKERARSNRPKQGFSDQLGFALHIGQTLRDALNNIGDAVISFPQWMVATPKARLRHLIIEWEGLIHDLILVAVGTAEATLAMDNGKYLGQQRLQHESRNILDARSRRLTELIQRINTVHILEEFDASEWEQKFSDLDSTVGKFLRLVKKP